jgi:hypothetical protein
LGDFEIEWLTPAGTPSPDKGANSVEETAAHTWATWRAVQTKARSMAHDAEAHLALHRRHGNAHITVVGAPPRKLDAWVVLQDMDPGGGGRAGKNKADRSAMSIEFGWKQTHAFGEKLDVPIPHKGLHILGGAMERAISRYGGPQ